MSFDYFENIQELIESDPLKAIESLERYENNLINNPIDLHFAYIQIIKICYKNRGKDIFLNKCIEICKKDIDIALEVLSIMKNDNLYKHYNEEMELVFTPPRFVSFQRLAIIYEKQGKYDEAIEISEKAIKLDLNDDTQGGFEGRIERLKKKIKNPPKPVKPPSDVTIKKHEELKSTSTDLVNKQPIANQKGFMITFSKSTSKNFERALSLAQQADTFEISSHENQDIYQALFHPDNYLNFITLYELIGNWKSTFVFKDGEMMDRKVLGQINYCYGDKIRTGSDSFCYGASMFTENPFGCHRLMIHSGQRPWYEWKQREDDKYVYIDKEAIKKQIEEKTKIYHHCPAFNYEKIMDVFNDLPSKIDKSSSYYKSLYERNPIHEITIKIETEQKEPTRIAKKDTNKKSGCFSSALLLISAPVIILSSIYYLF